LLRSHGASTLRRQAAGYEIENFWQINFAMLGKKPAPSLKTWCKMRRCEEVGLGKEWGCMPTPSLRGDGYSLHKNNPR